jgi:hypothetical protein
MKKLWLVVIFVSSLGACAANPGPAGRYDDNDYVTGSNLPRRGGTMPTEAQGVSKDTLDDWQRVRPAPRGPGGG